jgi:hypothetical protein
MIEGATMSYLIIGSQGHIRIDDIDGGSRAASLKNLCPVISASVLQNSCAEHPNPVIRWNDIC